MFNSKIEAAGEVLRWMSCLNLTRGNLYQYILSPNYKFDRQPFPKLSRSVTTQREEVKRRIYNQEVYDYFIVNYFLESKIGNCMEFARLAFIFLCYFNFDGLVSLCSGITFDHSFILITNLNQQLAPIVNFQMLPNSVLIIDPWLNAYFSPEKASAYLDGIAGHYKWGAVESLTFEITNLQSVEYHKTNSKEFVLNTLLSHRFALALQEIKQNYLDAQIGEKIGFRCTAAKPKPSAGLDFL